MKYLSEYEKVNEEIKLAQGSLEFEEQQRPGRIKSFSEQSLTL